MSSEVQVIMRGLLAGRHVFTLLACLGNMLSLLGRDSLRLAVLPMKEELNMTTEEVSHVLAGYNYGMIFTMLAWLAHTCPHVHEADQAVPPRCSL